MTVTRPELRVIDGGLDPNAESEPEGDLQLIFEDGEEHFLSYRPCPTCGYERLTPEETEARYQQLLQRATEEVTPLYDGPLF